MLVVLAALDELDRRQPQALLVDVGRVGGEAARRLAADLGQVADVAGERRPARRRGRSASSSCARACGSCRGTGRCGRRRRRARRSSSPSSSSVQRTVLRDRAHHRRRVVLLGDQVALAVEQHGREVEPLVEDRRVRRLHHHERHLGGDVRRARCAGRGGRRCRASAPALMPDRPSVDRHHARRHQRDACRPGQTSVVESGSSMTAGPATTLARARAIARRHDRGSRPAPSASNHDVPRRASRRAASVARVRPRAAARAPGTRSPRRLISSIASPGEREPVLRARARARSARAAAPSRRRRARRRAGRPRARSSGRHSAARPMRATRRLRRRRRCGRSSATASLAQPRARPRPGRRRRRGSSARE